MYKGYIGYNVYIKILLHFVWWDTRIQENQGPDGSEGWRMKHFPVWLWSANRKRRNLHEESGQPTRHLADERKQQSRKAVDLPAAVLSPILFRSLLSICAFVIYRQVYIHVYTCWFVRIIPKRSNLAEYARPRIRMIYKLYHFNSSKGWKNEFNASIESH